MRAAEKPDDPQRPAEPGSTRNRILDAAEALFSEHGFSGTAMRDLAAKADLQAASFYNHFRSKQELYEEVLERGLRPLFTLLDDLARFEWSEERADAALDDLMAHLSSRPHLPRLILHEAVAGGEHLTRIARAWLRPLYDRALAALRGWETLGRWDEDELPLLLAAFHHLILSHFAVAPLLREVFDEDPLSRDAFERHSRFLRKVVRLLLDEGMSPERGRAGEGARGLPEVR